MQLRLAVPDLVSPSYFPAIAAVELGCFADVGLDVDLRLDFPVTRASEHLRDGGIDLLAGAAHAALHAFPQWRGVRLATALSKGMYWFLVIATENPQSAAVNIAELHDLRIGAAPGPDLGLEQALLRAGVDLESAGISIVPVPTDDPDNISFGVTAAKALQQGKIDAFWANGMGAEVAVKSGAGRIVLDARRSTGPEQNFTFPALLVTETMVNQQPDVVERSIKAIATAQRMLREDPGVATTVGERLFPSFEAGLISSLIARDADFYRGEMTPDDIEALNAFARIGGLDPGAASYDEVVLTQFAAGWLR